MQRSGEWPLLTVDLIQRILDEDRLPNPAEQAELLIQWLGDNQQSPGSFDTFNYKAMPSRLGGSTGDDVLYILDSLQSVGVIERKGVMGAEQSARLTLGGWQRFEDLKHARIETRMAFMAMEFDEPQLDSVFSDVFKPAARRAGFDLVRLTERPRAGLIDVRLRSELRRSRFVVADLTTDNLGAYWEAGFAEGLGRPVIYTCRFDRFENARTHFDVNHSLTIKWDPSNLASAGDELADTIRATLPAEAVLVDVSREPMQE